ncbi:Ferric uptake regulation protein [Rosistilla carotiformis]|uniref:Ferric uptake regulation protein n=1 Tax=Rosistilla carotiformis TaxID=2528017 RepID=A0A518JNI5_9BACT|nr:Fur family transcriptional regulator [Rosistilla carotiformis]QDV67071.1 Ferric uptake regulation protein [Rosistilla carotiformis]
MQSRGQRNTEQRRFLVDRVFSNHEHFDVDSLIEQLPRKGQENYVSRPTVYRALKEFVDAGLLRCFQLEGRSVYEHDYGYPQHDHLYCTRCQKLIEFTSDEIMKIRAQVAAQHSFRVTSHRLIIQGVCQDCSRRRKKRKQDLI